MRSSYWYQKVIINPKGDSTTIREAKEKLASIQDYMKTCCGFCLKRQDHHTQEIPPSLLRCGKLVSIYMLLQQWNVSEEALEPSQEGVSQVALRLIVND